MASVHDEAAQKSAANGALWLDKCCPAWHKHINISCLNLRLPSKCILGQLSEQRLAPDFHSMCYRLSCGTSGSNALSEHGFTRPDVETGDESNAVWASLNVAWVREIDIRRAKDAI